MFRPLNSRVSIAHYGATVASQVRHQSFMGEERETAKRSKLSYSHPLAPKDPATRNITLPDSVHAQANSREAVPPSVLQKRAHRALALQLQQDVLWEGTVVDNVQHSVLQHFARLRSNPKYRSSKQMMIVGGKEMLRELVEQGHAPRYLLIGSDKKEEKIPPWVRDCGSQIVRVERRVLEECVPGTDGYVGDFDIPPPPPKETLIANKNRMERVLVLDNVDDSGMLGTILRTAAGFHYDAVITVNHCADLYDHRVIRAARAAHFQSAVPFFSLREEDGDDAMAMINHVIERNDLQPLCYSPVNDNETGSDTHVRHPHRTPHRSGEHSTAGHSTSPPIPQRCGLTDYCIRNFSRPQDTERPSEDKPKGFLLFAGPNHTRTMMRRVRQRVIRPATQLLLDEIPTTDLSIALPVVLHAMRPSGDWDYLPASQKSDPPTAALNMKRASVDLGPNRLDFGEKHLSLDYDEQVQRAHEANQLSKERRLARKLHSDYDMWMMSEEDRIAEIAKNEKDALTSPWKAPKWKKQKGASGMPDAIPNIINDYRLPMDRDRLREERMDGEAYVRPQNYDFKGGTGKARP